MTRQTHGSRLASASTALLAILLCAPIIGLNQYVSHQRTDDADQYFYAYMGRQLADGKALYSEVWDFKPPGIYWIGALAAGITRYSSVGPLLVCAAALALAFTVLFAWSRSYFSPATAVLATTVGCIFLLQPEYLVGSLRPETFILPLEAMTLAAYFWGTRSSRPWLLPLAGVGLAGAFLIKQTALALAVAIALDQWVVRPLCQRDVWPSRPVRNTLLLLSGAVAALGATLFELARTTELAEVVEAVFVVPARYAAEARRDGWMPWEEWRQHLQAMALPVVLAGCAVGFTAWHTVVRRTDSRSATTDTPPDSRPAGLAAVADIMPMLLIWLSVATAAALATPHRQTHYLAPALTPLIVLATGGIHLLISACREGRRLTFAAWVCVVWMAYMCRAPIVEETTAAAAIWVGQERARDDDENARLAAVVQCHCPPGEPVYISGYRPRLWLLADRPPAVRHPGAMSAARLGRHAGPILDEIVAGLNVAPPRVIVVGGPELAALDWNATAVDAESVLQGVPNYASAAAPAWVEAHYVPAREDNRGQVWVRRDVAAREARFSDHVAQAGDGDRATSGG